eukprot:scaffold925_cov133-Isochrysis_galbana.AAC.9
MSNEQPGTPGLLHASTSGRHTSMPTAPALLTQPVTLPETMPAQSNDWPRSLQKISPQTSFQRLAASSKLSAKVSSYTHLVRLSVERAPPQM